METELREFLDMNMKVHHTYNISNLHIEIRITINKILLPDCKVKTIA